MSEQTLKLLAPVTLDGTETVKWTDSGGAKSVTLDAGTYWPHADTDPSDYRGLYTHILSKMNAAAAGGYTFTMSHVTPTASGSTWPFGIRIATTNTGLSWTWDASGTVNALGVLGWRTTSGTQASTSGRVDSPLMARYVWHPTQPPSIYASTPRRVVTPSTEYVERTDAYWFDQGARRLRQVQVEYQLAAHVYNGRASLNGWYQAAGVAVGDDGNALEWCWEQVNRGGTLLWVWYEDGDDLDLLATNGNGYVEVARLVEPDQMREYSAMLRVIRVAGEMYTVEIDTVRSDDDASNWSI